MRKFHTLSQDSPAPAKRSRAPRALALTLALLASPLLYEAGQVIVSRWQSLTGTYWEPSTPILDAVTGWGRATNLEVWGYAHRAFNSGPWQAQTAVPAAIIWAVVMAVVFLRRVR